MADDTDPGRGPDRNADPNGDNDGDPNDDNDGDKNGDHDADPGSDDIDPDVDPLAWARDHMPVLAALRERDAADAPFEGWTVAVSSHLEATTGVFIETLAEVGAHVLGVPSEPQSTHGDVVTHLDARDDVEMFAEDGMSDEAFADAQRAVLERGPDLVCSDGGALTAILHDEYPDLATDVVGGTEQTTAGVTRIEAMADEGVLAFPVYGVNDTPMKHWFDNVHGTGESSLVNVQITTNASLTGKTIVVAGYGYCGRGIARKARGLGAHTVVTEVDPRKAIEAHMDGHRVLSMAEAATAGDIFVTSTGTRDVLGREHFERMQDGATLANAGHYDVEIDLDALADYAGRTTEPRPGVTRYHLPDGRRLNLLAGGRLVNLTGPYSEGHPAEVMDTTFASIYVGVRDIRDADLPPDVYDLPDRLDRAVAERKLETLGITVDEPTGAQVEYVESWRERR
jgi:adenosylhomocysteinase